MKRCPTRTSYAYCLDLEVLEDRTLPQAGPPIWTPLGPQPQTDSTGITVGANEKVSGRVTALAVVTNDNNQPVSLVAGSASGFIWTTTSLNGNRFANSPTWQVATLVANQGAQQPLPINQWVQGENNVGAIAVDPRPGNHNILYAGTGEADYAGDAGAGAGILKSVNGGQTWFLLPSTGTAQNPTAFVGQSISKIIVTQNGPNGTIFVAVVPTGKNDPTTSDGLYKSTDGGDSWIRVKVTGGLNVPTDVAYTTLAGGQTVLYAGLGDPRAYSFVTELPRGIWKSTDLGVTWVPAWSPPPRLFVGAIALAADSTPQAAGGSDPIIYAAVARVAIASSPLQLVLRSTDNGQTWPTIADTTSLGKVANPFGQLVPPNQQPLITSPDQFGSQAVFDLSIALQPGNPNVVFLGGVHAFESNNGGLTWMDGSRSV
jgi:hypothetical protein